MTIGELFRLILPVFALIAVGVALRRFHWVEGAAETSLIKLVVYVCMPCLVFETVVGNGSLREPGNLLLPPLAGFISTVAGFGVAYLGARAIGLAKGTGLRTFAVSAGICNYSYLPLPIVGGIWGERAQGLVLVHNLGVDTALWSVGLIILTGASAREGWKKLISPVLVTLLVAVVINLAGLSSHVPVFVGSMAHSLGVCTVPIGLLMTGVSLADYLDQPSKLLHRNIALAACVVRLLIMPALMLCFAKWLPCSVDLKRVLVVEAAMPAAVFPIILARHYGGQPLTAVQVVLATTAAGLVACPLWIRAGLSWVGVG
jgi:malate permease and related proteins